MSEALPQMESLELWSVTTLTKDALGIGDGLVNWIARTVATAAVDKRAVVDAMLKEGDREGAIKWLVDHRWRKAEEAKLRGTDVHKAAEALALGLEPTLDDRIRPYVEQYRRWLADFQPTFLMAEAPVYNVEHRYAGTLDAIMDLGSKLPLVADIKTTEHPPDGDKARPPWPEAALQLCAYSRCPEVGVHAEQRYAGGRGGRRYYLYDPTVTHERMPEVDQDFGLCIVVSPWDCVAIPVWIGEQVWRSFLYVQQVARWQKELSRHVFKAPLMVPSTVKEEA